MRFVSFKIEGETGYGAVVRNAIVRLDTAPGAPADLKSYIAAHHSDPWPELPTTDEIPLDAVELLPPIPDPGKVICVTPNFYEPARDDKPAPEYPMVFTRFAEAQTGHGAPLMKPSISDKYDFEGELAVIIGKPGYKIARDTAMEHVAGYSCFNDGSVRDWQKHSAQFTPGKNFYKSGAFGPWIVSTDEIPDPKVLELQTRINGVVKQEISMDRMIFDIPWLISYFSTFTPLAPGDVLAIGTPSGFGSTRTPPEFLSAGDVVEVEISGIGVLRNEVHQG